MGKRQKILDSAFQLFGERGYQGTTMKGIAERAGLVPGALYIYFPSKEALFEATVEDGWDRFLSEFSRAVDSTVPLGERTRAALELGFRSLKIGLPLLQGMLFETSQRQLLQNKLDTLCACLERLLSAGSGIPVQPPELWRTMIRLNIVGVLFCAALAQAGQVDREIGRLREAVERLLAGRLQGKVGP